MLALPASVIRATGLAPAIASFVIDVARRSWKGRVLQPPLRRVRVCSGVAPDGYDDRLWPQGSRGQYDGRCRRKRSAVANTSSGSDVSFSTLAP